METKKIFATSAKVIANVIGLLSAVCVRRTSFNFFFLLRYGFMCVFFAQVPRDVRHNSIQRVIMLDALNVHID